MSSEREAQLLAERAKALAARPVSVDDAADLEAVVVAAVDKDRIGVPLMAAREIVPFAGEAVVPGAPNWLRTIVQLRGELLSVLDLHAWWKPGQTCSGKQLVVVEGGCGPMAILVDAVLEVRDVGSQDLAQALGEDALQARPGVRAVTKDLVFLLDIDAMQRHSALIVNQGGMAAAGEAGARE